MPGMSGLELGQPGQGDDARDKGISYWIIMLTVNQGA